MPRPLLIGLGVLAFVVVAVQLTRLLSAENVERSAIYALLRDQARGDTAAVTARLEGCVRGCAEEARRIVARAKTTGEVKILRLDPADRFSLSETTGRSRVAWAAALDAGGRTVVQCVTVRRTWSFTAGSSVTLLRLGAPLPPEQSC